MSENFKKLANKNGVEFYAYHDGVEWRYLGRIKTYRPKMAIQPFGNFLNSVDLPFVNNSQAAPVIDVSKIPDYDYYQSNVPVLDQNGLGACCGHSHATMVMKARDIAGYTFEGLSADSLYAQVNGGHDRGSDPADCITALEQNGICLLSDVPDQWVLWQNISADAKENALRFRIPAVAVYQCNNFAEVLTADYLRFSVTYTINVGPNFGPGNDGVVGFMPGYANHCVAAGEGKRTVNGVPQLRSRNSWSTSWGLNGLFYIVAKHIDNQPGAECYALMWTLVDPKDPSHLPIALS